MLYTVVQQTWQQTQCESRQGAGDTVELLCGKVTIAPSIMDAIFHEERHVSDKRFESSEKRGILFSSYEVR